MLGKENSGMRSIAYGMKEVTDDRGKEHFWQDLDPEVGL